MQNQYKYDFMKLHLRLDHNSLHRKDTKIVDTPKIAVITQNFEKGSTAKESLKKDANGTVNSSDPDQTAPLIY